MLRFLAVFNLGSYMKFLLPQCAPSSLSRKLRGLRSEDNIKAMADAIQISPGANSLPFSFDKDAELSLSVYVELCKLERKYAPELLQRDRGMDANVWSKVVQWMASIQTHCSWGVSVLFLAICILNRYLSKSPMYGQDLPVLHRRATIMRGISGFD